MDRKLKITLYALTLDCKEPLELAKFYESMLNWTIRSIEEDWVYVSGQEIGCGTCPGILIQKNTEYVSPVWPHRPDCQQQMAHIDFTVSDLAEAVRHALNCGAVISEYQYSDQWKVMFDPAGHPFCLCL